MAIKKCMHSPKKLPAPLDSETKNFALINSSALPLKGQMVHPLGEGAPGPPFGEIFAI